MKILQYEQHTDPLLPRRQFLKRLAGHALLVLVVGGLSLLGGMAGYHWLEGMPWIDSFLNAAMILGGMGPVAPLQTPAGKLFAGLYALYSGLVLLVMAGVLLAPVVHRLLHAFHLNVAEDSGGDTDEGQDGQTAESRRHATRAESTLRGQKTESTLTHDAP